MDFEHRIKLETSIRQQFKKLSKMSEETIQKNIKQKELQSSSFNHEEKYYIDQIYNPSQMPDKFDVEFDVIRHEYVNGKKFKELTDLWNWYKTRVSTLKSNLPPGRCIKILVKEKYTQKYIGLISLSDACKNLKDRDDFIGWDMDTKFSKDLNGIKRLDYIMDISTCVPLQPFGYNFNGGKLLAMLCFSKDIQDIIEKCYGHQLALFQTMGVNGKSAMYDRCNLKKGDEYFLKYVGLSSGHGVTSLIPDSLYKECVEYLKFTNDEMFKHDHSIFSSKRKKLRTCMRYLNISTDFLDSKLRKGVYVGFTDGYSKQFLTGQSQQFKSNNCKNKEYICSNWISRWAFNRFENRIKFKNIRYNDFSLVSFERQQKTIQNTEIQRERRKRLRETEDEDTRQKRNRRNNNRTKIKKYLSSHSTMNVDDIEKAINSIDINVLETHQYSDIIKSLDKKYNISETKTTIYKGFILKDGWGTIYLIKNKIDGKGYIGQASHFRTKKRTPAGFPRRMEEHFKCTQGKIECVLLDRAIIKHGWDNFEKIPILDCKIEYLDHFEKYFIKEYSTHRSTGLGYNATWGGQDKRGCNYRTGMQHHMWGKTLSDTHKQNISNANINSKRQINDDILNQILSFKHTNYTETEVIENIKAEHNIEVHRGLIENIWSGKTKPLNDQNRLSNYDELITKKRKQPSSRRTDDSMIEDIFKLKFENLSAEEACNKLKEKHENIELALITKVWSMSLTPRFPSEEYKKLSNDKRIVKKRKLDDKYIEEIYFSKFENLTQKSTITKMKEKYGIDIKQQDVSGIWRQQLKPLKPTDNYATKIQNDVIVKPTKILSDEQREYVLSKKGTMSGSKMVQHVKDTFNIDVKKSYINDIWRPKNK